MLFDANPNVQTLRTKRLTRPRPCRQSFERTETSTVSPTLCRNAGGLKPVLSNAATAVSQRQFMPTVSWAGTFIYVWQIS